MKKAKEIMICNPYTLNTKDTLIYAAQEFLKREIDGAPVLDEKGNIVGIFTKRHIIAGVANNISNCVTVGELMSYPVVTVNTETSLEEIYNAKVSRLPVIDDDGSLVGIITRTDCLKALRQMAEQSRDQLKIILQSAYNGIAVVNREGIITIWNPGMERLSKMQASDAIGKHVMSVIPNSGMLEVLKTGTNEYGVKLNFGDTVTVSNRAPLFQNGEIIGAVAVMQGISDFAAVEELKSSQRLNKELDAIIDSVYDGIFITDGKGVTTRINKTYTLITGIQQDEVMGKHIQELVDTGYCSEGVTLHVLDKKTPQTIMHTVKGDKKLLVTGNPVFDDNGEIIFVVTTARDMTNLMNIKKSLRNQ